jgi:hypothetical protein
VNGQELSNEQTMRAPVDSAATERCLPAIGYPWEIIVRRLSLFLVLLAAITNANAVTHTNARITGVGLSFSDGNLRFTINNDPNAIFLTNNFTGEQLKRVVALILSAYHAQATVAFIKSEEITSFGTPHYTSLTDISLGTYTWD